MKRSVSPTTVIALVVLVVLCCAIVVAVGSCKKRNAERLEAGAIRNSDGPGGPETPEGSDGSGKELGGARKAE